MKNKYNINLVNQYKNEELYNEEIFDFILNNTDINELKSEQFDIIYHNAMQIKGNFESFLYKGIKYNEVIKKEMNDKIQKKWSKQLLEPLYFIKLSEKDYILEEAGYEFLTNMNKYLLKVFNKKAKSLNDSEGKFVIDLFLKETPSIYINENDKKEISELFKIFFNQKEYLNKKNDKSSINNFFEHVGMKKVLSLFTEEEKNSLMRNTLDYEQILKAYYPKLLRKKHFDLSSQIQSFDNQEIVSWLSANVSADSKQWFKQFLEKGSGLSLSNLDKKIKIIGFSQSGHDTKKDSLALFGGINLFKKLKNNFDNESVTKLMFASVIEAKSERAYKELRSFTELPKDEAFQKYLNQQQIYKKSIVSLENEILNEKLEEKLTSKPKDKIDKIDKIKKI